MNSGTTTATATGEVTDKHITFVTNQGLVDNDGVSLSDNLSIAGKILECTRQLVQSVKMRPHLILSLSKSTNTESALAILAMVHFYLILFACDGRGRRLSGLDDLDDDNGVSMTSKAVEACMALKKAIAKYTNDDIIAKVKSTK
jgi:hypothetical protein